ncbi:substrate-binding domain-containing protein [Streptomyces canus]
MVGFDDLPFVEWVTPRLTTVRTPLADMTVRAACAVPLLLSGQQRETAQAEVTIELVVRDSSGPPPVTGRAVERSQGGEGRLSLGGRPPWGVRSGRRAGHGAVVWRSSAAHPAILGWEFESRFTNALVKPERVRPRVALIQVPSGAADVEGPPLTDWQGRCPGGLTGLFPTGAPVGWARPARMVCLPDR